MSEEKLYAIKNDEGEWLDQDRLWGPGTWATPDKDEREKVAKCYGGHVVALVEEPEKETVSENVGKAIDSLISADTYAQASEAFRYLFVSRKKEDLKRIMKSVRNGYTVKKEKRYLVALDGLVTTDGAKQYLTKKDGKWFACRRMPGMHQDFTDEELNKAPEWAQQLDREEVTDDDE